MLGISTWLTSGPGHEPGPQWRLQTPRFVMRQETKEAPANGN
jgi:hypothetical protein